MTVDWVDGSTNYIVANKPLHSGITVDLIQGNIERAHSQTRVHLVGGHHTSAFEISQAVSATDEWELMDDFNPLMIPLRTKYGSTDLRDITFGLEGKCSGAGTATIRAYLLDSSSLPTIDITNGIIDNEAYVDLAYSSTSYAYASDTIVPGEVAGWFSADIPGLVVPVAFLFLAFRATTSITVSVRMPTILEVTV